jgi:uncharacterized membrane protein YqhA
MNIWSVMEHNKNLIQEELIKPTLMIIYLGLIGLFMMAAFFSVILLSSYRN